MNGRRLGLLAVLAALGAAAAAAGTRLAGQRRAGRSEARTYTCQCGARYRVTGVDRHRVYWPDQKNTDGEPVLGDECTQCGTPLPGGRETAAV